MSIASVMGMIGQGVCYYLLGYKSSVSTLVGIFMTIAALTNLTLTEGMGSDGGDGLNVPA